MTTADQQAGVQTRSAAPEPPHPHAITRLVLRPSASPMPLGYATVAIASCMVAGLQTRILPAADQRAVALVLLPAFLLQIIVAIMAFNDRDTAAATLMASFAASWLVNAMISLAAPVGAASTLGFFLFVFTVFVGVMSVLAFPKHALFAAAAVATVRFFLSGVAEVTGSQAVSMAAGIVGFILSAVAMYTAVALLMEDMRGRTVLPIGRRGAARIPIEGDIAAQLAGIEHAAGVRRSLLRPLQFPAEVVARHTWFRL